jgi:OFA family oxalate/formate antiporter-like MFS transporter
VRTAAFQCIMLCHALIEFLWCGAQLFLVDLFGSHGLSPSKVASAQAVGSGAAVVATAAAGMCIDRLGAHRKRWVLVFATVSGAAAALALVYCNGMALACAATALLGAMMGPLDVVFATLYADSFGRKHLASILGLVSTLSYIAIGASPVVYGAVRDRSGSFTPLLGSLVVLLPLAAAGLALSPPPRMGAPRAHA